MFVLIRSFIVWCMLLALPYQGYAAAAMMICVPATMPAAHPAAHAMSSAGAEHPATSHDHGAMLAAMAAAVAAEGADGQIRHPVAHAAPAGAAHAAHVHDADLADRGSAGTHSGHDHDHGGSKCSGAACCIAGAPVLTGLAALPVLPAVSGPVPFYAEYLPAVHLAHPDRPPQLQTA